MAGLELLPPWTAVYAYTVQPDQSRTSIRGGFSKQARRSNRFTRVFNVTRFLKLSELPYFESYVLDDRKDGSLKFTDRYQDSSGLVTGTIRILGGNYSVISDTLNHTVTCQIEVF